MQQTCLLKLSSLMKAKLQACIIKKIIKEKLTFAKLKAFEKKKSRGLIDPKLIAAPAKRAGIKQIERIN